MGWALTLSKFLDFHGGHLFEGGCLLTFWTFMVGAYWKGGWLIE